MPAGIQEPDKGRPNGRLVVDPIVLAASVHVRLDPGDVRRDLKIDLKKNVPSLVERSTNRREVRPTIFPVHPNLILQVWRGRGREAQRDVPLGVPSKSPGSAGTR